MPVNPTQTAHLFVAVGDFFADKNATGGVGVFRHQTGEAGWRHVMADRPAYCVSVCAGNSARVLVGTRSGVVLSDDGGLSFRPAHHAAPPRAIWSLTQDPHQPARWYAGASPAAIYRSDDHGESWDLLAEPTIPDRAPMPFPPRVLRITVHPRRAGELVAALEIAGVLRSTDGGRHWHDCSDPLIALADRHPELRSRIVCDLGAEGMLDGHAVCASEAWPDAVLLACRMGIFRSDDGGSQWRNLQLNRFSDFSYGRDVRVSPHDPSMLYACLSVASNSKNGALMRSLDFGETWQRFDKVQPHGTLMAVSPHPTDRRQVYVAARYGEVFGTRDEGDSWFELPLSGIQHVYGMACG